MTEFQIWPFGTRICTPVFGRLNLGHEQIQVLDDAALAGDFDFISQPEGAEQQQHDAGGHVAERALEGQADGQGRGADDGDEAGGLDPDQLKDDEEDQHQDGVTREARQEGRQRRVDAPL